MNLLRKHYPRRKSAPRSRMGVERLENRLLLSVTAELENTPALYNPGNGTFYLRNENAGGVADTAFDFGPAGQGWIPITGDWNNDGVDTVGLYEPTSSAFFLRNENAAGVADAAVAFGAAGNGWTPVTGDWDGDGTDTIGLYDPASGFWFLRDELAAGIADEFFAYGPGGNGWLPIVGDWNHDGSDTVGVYDPATGTFYMRDENSAGFATTVVQYGPGGDGWTPLTGDWDGDGVDTFALHNQAGGTFNLRNVDEPGPADMSFGYGPAGSDWTPLTGHWIFDPSDTQGGIYATPGESDDVVPTLFTLLVEHADFLNEVGLYVVDDSSGRVGAFAPGDPGYAAAALGSSSRHVIFSRDQHAGSVSTLNLPGGSLFALYLVQDNTAEAFLAANPTNQVGSIPLAFFSLSDANPDGFDHVKKLGPIVFAWEDQTGGGDEDFNDSVVVFQYGALAAEDQPPVVTIVTPTPGAVSDTQVTITGTAIDDVSGIATAEAQIDSGAFFPIALDSAGNFSFNTALPLDGSADGPHTVRVRAVDRAGNESNLAETSFVLDTGGAVNTPPVAVNDSYSMDEGEFLAVDIVMGLLANDTDADGDPLTILLLSSPANGGLSVRDDGSFDYAPGPNFNGTDGFTYRLNDGAADSEIATVTITVNAVNDAPVAANDGFETDEDLPLGVPAPGVLINDTDDDGDALTAVLGTTTANGTLTLNPDGSFTYVPNDDFNGTDSFTYQADDGADLSGLTTVFITVNPLPDDPVAVNDAFETDEDLTLNIPLPGVLGNDTDADDDPLTAVLATTTANGALTLNPDGSFTYDPNDNFNGQDSFTYVANDGTVDSAPATVTITINAVNDAPVALNDSYTTSASTPLTVVAADGVLDNDTDVENDPLTAVIGDNPTGGMVTLNLDGSFSYSPNQGFTGPDSFTYQANDGSVDSAIATVTITVVAQTPPEAVNDSFIMDEDTILNQSVPDVLDNDTDDNGDPLTAMLATPASFGVVTLNPDGTFTYDPNDDFFGDDSFTYVANDGFADSPAATVFITVNGVNDAPMGVDDFYATDEDTLLTIPNLVFLDDVLDNDTDAEGDPRTAVQVTGAGNGIAVLNADGSFTYDPNDDFNGLDFFTYQVSDGVAPSATVFVFITVNAVNDAPTAIDHAFPTPVNTTLNVDLPGVLAGASDIDGDMFFAVPDAPPANGFVSVSSDGSFSYTPNTGFVGDDTFTYHVSDGVLDSEIRTVTITVGGGQA